MQESRQNHQAAQMQAAAHLYHALFTGLVLTVTTQRGSAAAAELVYHLFRRKQELQFLPGLEKLGIRELPPAVASAQYHYLSNQLGGVKVEYMPESDTKAWIRYPPPRWAWAGTAIAGIPSEVSAAMLRGWHANNGVLLGDLRLRFVCTKQTVDGQPGLEGYYEIADRELSTEERLRFDRQVEAPRFDPSLAPRVDAADWPEERLAKAYRNYAMDYVSTGLVVLCDLWGPLEARALGGRAARLIGLHLFDDLCGVLNVDPTGGAGAFLDVFEAVSRGQGDDVTRADNEITQSSWRLSRALGSVSDAVFDAWQELFVGLALSADPRAELECRERHLDPGHEKIVWSVHVRA